MDLKETVCEGVAQNRDQCLSYEHINEPSSSIKASNFLIIWVTISSFSKIPLEGLVKPYKEAVMPEGQIILRSV
jgi:hypothetical protein